MWLELFISLFSVCYSKVYYLSVIELNLNLLRELEITLAN